MFKSEVQKFTKGRYFLIVTLVMIIISFFLTMREGAMRYGLLTNTDLINYLDYESFDHKNSATVVSIYYGVDKEWVLENSTNTLDIAHTIHGEQFNRLINVNLGMMILAGFFAAYYIGMDFKTRLFNNLLYVGHHRTTIFFSRIITYFVFTIIVSLLTTFGLILLFSNTIFSKIPSGEIWNAVFSRVIFDLAVMSIPLVFIYIFKGAVWPAVCTIIVEIGLWFGLTTYGKPLVIEPFEMTLGATPKEIQYLPTHGLMDVPLFIPIAIIIVCVLSSWYLFTRANLE